jgi:hypothetical protein
MLWIKAINLKPFVVSFPNYQRLKFQTVGFFRSPPSIPQDRLRQLRANGKILKLMALMLWTGTMNFSI